MKQNSSQNGKQLLTIKRLVRAVLVRMQNPALEINEKRRQNMKLRHLEVEIARKSEKKTAMGKANRHAGSEESREPIKETAKGTSSGMNQPRYSATSMCCVCK